MIKKGEYGIYKGEEYSIIPEGSGKVTLRTRDKASAQNGFQAAGLKKNVFIKQIDQSELENAYEYKLSANYRGQEFAIEGVNEENGTIILKSMDPESVDKLGFSSLGKYEYIKKVSVDDVQIQEKKSPILGFGEK
ncbi:MULTISPECIES: hypothetical protein [Metabacillus]|uniref:Uncharacterized protein n=1 Tax=Metabacillus indicus TaxID=246786 RepID=A0A084GJW5_METID|nr:MULTISPECIES: hypothetical protein [Metabacillus]KEZ47627.1 hypothetical protein GS18_0219825 [Metabacillus indicus]KEZ48119.1 hypothetical protein AZ46_0219325 [Metabacillus indicus LMG 22858]